ncbi:MAG TPA: hypothetical protein VFC79_02650 [Tissierellaceae bacterium]|nr:hypothetical protein [Tissierellaceae bacterium]
MKLPFDRKEWDFEELTHRKSIADRKRTKQNCVKFGKWMIDTFKRTAPRPLNEGEKYHCQGMRMNPENNLYLRDHVDGWTWLDYSPVDDDSVGLHEVVIDHWFDERKIK